MSDSKVIKMKVNIKQFGDLHYNKFCSRNLLNKISEEICDGKNSHTIFTGDLIDSTDFIRNNRIEREVLLEWLNDISKKTILIMTLGNHDIYSYDKENNAWIYDYDESFWKEINSIPGITLLSHSSCYEDDLIYISGINPGYGYYENETRNENKEEIIKELKKKKNLFQDLSQSKLKLFLCHSPIYMTDEEVLKYINEFNIVLSGHMHNGLILPIMENIFPKNMGLISPLMHFFPDNARGIKNIEYNDKIIKLIITGGITKLAPSHSIVSRFNSLFPSNIEQITYDTIDKSIKVKTLNL